VGALVGAPPEATPAHIDSIAIGTAFMMFGAPAGSFWYDVAWDLGILAVRDGGHSVAVLAATDTDEAEI
jgi:hypothetical protein